MLNICWKFVDICWIFGNEAKHGSSGAFSNQSLSASFCQMLSSEDDDTFVQSSPWPYHDHWPWPWQTFKIMISGQFCTLAMLSDRVLFNASQRVSIPGGGWSAQGEKSNQRKLIKTRPATYYTQCYSFSATLCSKWIRKLISTKWI